MTYHESGSLEGNQIGFCSLVQKIEVSTVLDRGTGNSTHTDAFGLQLSWSEFGEDLTCHQVNSNSCESPDSGEDLACAITPELSTP